MRWISETDMRNMKYPIGIQTFSDLIEGGYVYVDKTEYIFNLVDSGKYYFLSRPRRFGKSLLLSTIESFFRGHKHLFKGLYIYNREWEWDEYPVFHLMLNGQDYDSLEKLDEYLNNFMSAWEDEYGLPKPQTEITVSTRFYNCINNAAQKSGRKVVVLIDEYDQPILYNIERGDETLLESMRQHLQSFYSVMKAQDRNIRFAMLTGISKFSKVSVFSGLNNLKDISLDVKANGICGISESELEPNFNSGICTLAESQGMTIAETKRKLKTEFDGYHFAKAGEGIYNPFSLLNTFSNEDISHYWIQTGTPSFLIRILKSRDWELSEIPGSTCSEMDIVGSDRYLSNPIPLLFQSGYLTIKGYDREFGEYTMDYPNEEVAEGFANELLSAYSDEKDHSNLIKKFIKDVRNGNVESFMKSLQILLSDVPYDQILNKELHYENMMYLVMKLMGFHTHTEYKTSDGRIDMMVSTDKYVYLMEFKLHDTAENAIAQINNKNYMLPFLDKGKEIILIGASFDSESRRLGNWIIERM